MRHFCLVVRIGLTFAFRVGTIDAVCPICLVAFRAHLAEEELASVMESPANDEADLGVTRLQDTCKQWVL